jgi:hypothetical protein
MDADIRESKFEETKSTATILTRYSSFSSFFDLLSLYIKSIGTCGLEESRSLKRNR